jgi:hypothetical protein
VKAGDLEEISLDFLGLSGNLTKVVAIVKDEDEDLTLPIIVNNNMDL